MIVKNTFEHKKSCILHELSIVFMIHLGAYVAIGNINANF